MQMIADSVLPCVVLSCCFTCMSSAVAVTSANSSDDLGSSKGHWNAKAGGVSLLYRTYNKCMPASGALCQEDGHLHTATAAAQVPSVRQRYNSALASLCLLGWRQHALQQRTDPHSRLRQRLRAATGGRCGDARQYRRVVLLTCVWASWRGLVTRGAAHYRCVRTCWLRSRTTGTTRGQVEL